MSYILDALTKAAKQRDRQAPVLQRLLAPASSPRSVWTRTRGGLVALLSLNAGLLAVLLVVWLSPVAIAPPPESVSSAVPSTSPPEASLAPEPRPTREMRRGKAPQREPDGVAATGPARPARDTCPAGGCSGARRADARGVDLLRPAGGADDLRQGTQVRRGRHDRGPGTRRGDS